MQRPMIEDYRHGYPQFSALISSADEFFISRRFRRLRARLQLLKQDEITILEQRLDRLDNEEPNDLFLGSTRWDANQQRQSLLSDIEHKLAEYDKFTEATMQVLRHSDPEPRDVRSVRNWLEGKGAIARDEEAYLYHDRDLFALAPGADSAMRQFEDWVTRRLMQIPGFRDRKPHDASSDPNIVIYSGSLIRKVAEGLIITLVTVLLLLPIVICNVVLSSPVRLCVVMAATVLYLLVLANLTRAKTMELVIAATTYATVLIVFVSGNEIGPHAAG